MRADLELYANFGSNALPLLISFCAQKILELPRVGRVELGLVVAVEDVGVVLEWVPVGGDGNKPAQVGLTDLQHVIMG